MKEQGSALRIVAFAVAIAIVLGLASVMFTVTASAEDDTSVSDNLPKSVTGTFGNYSAVKFTATNQILIHQLFLHNMILNLITVFLFMNKTVN